MASIFTHIIEGEIPSYKVTEDDNFYAFLDINPVQRGHTLVVPKKEIDYIFDIDDDMLGRMMIFAKKVALKIKQEIECKKVAVVVIGLEVAHAHIHLIPVEEVGDIDFSKKLNIPEEEFTHIINRLRF